MQTRHLQIANHKPKPLPNTENGGHTWAGWTMRVHIRTKYSTTEFVVKYVTQYMTVVDQLEDVLAYNGLMLNQTRFQIMICIYICHILYLYVGFFIIIYLNVNNLNIPTYTFKKIYIHKCIMKINRLESY